MQKFKIKNSIICLSVAILANYSCDLTNATTSGQEQLIAPTETKAIVGEFIDERDGIAYRTLTYADGQTWMDENLRYHPDMLDIPTKSINHGAGYFTYVRSRKKILEYKELEPHAAATDQQRFELAKYSQEDQNKLLGVYYSVESAQKACPSGWHLPSLKEWNNLVEKYGKVYPRTPFEEKNLKLPESITILEPTGFTSGAGRIKFDKSYLWASDLVWDSYGLDVDKNPIYDTCVNYLEISHQEKNSVLMAKEYKEQIDRDQYQTLMPCRCIKNN